MVDLIGPGAAPSLKLPFNGRLMTGTALLLALSISSCSTVAPSQGYRSAGSTAAPWQISGELFDFTNVKISINGSREIDGRVSLLSGEGALHSIYGGKQVMASCSTSSGLMTAATKCIVFVENERAATLSF
ncbi:hypothetical protein Rfer_0975 [Rhodoferax ferrireducens T118]|uniref:Uncharacterized protein n=1 Tax=Albidiferax ferrireducens (strain ATCC BAA-621 / DSM 15236 / T118) TaxID=338969 RepID=Q21ZT4_ALBFT|nr:hypothetical protein Rfer_0975 [Rhodoferax ferrireducens T118]